MAEMTCEHATYCEHENQTVSAPFRGKEQNHSIVGYVDSSVVLGEDQRDQIALHLEKDQHGVF